MKTFLSACAFIILLFAIPAVALETDGIEFRDFMSGEDIQFIETPDYILFQFRQYRSNFGMDIVLLKSDAETEYSAQALTFPVENWRSQTPRGYLETHTLYLDLYEVDIERPEAVYDTQPQPLLEPLVLDPADDIKSILFAGFTYSVGGPYEDAQTYPVLEFEMNNGDVLHVYFKYPQTL